MFKKDYQKPATDVIECQAQKLLQGSGSEPPPWAGQVG